MCYNYIFLDEVSMVLKFIMEHVLFTVNQLSLCPLLVMCGDRCQQPIEMANKQTTQVPSILQQIEFYSIVYHVHSRTQHRCEDEELLQILNHLCYYKPVRTVKMAYPCVPAYSVTICKSQGQILKEVVIWMDVNTVPAATAYITLSKVRCLENLYFLMPTEKSHYTPYS